MGWGLSYIIELVYHRTSLILFKASEETDTILSIDGCFSSHKGFSLVANTIGPACPPHSRSPGLIWSPGLSARLPTES
jgi:hypothetical protein